MGNVRELFLENRNGNKYGDGELRRGLGKGNRNEDRGRTAAVTIEGRSPSLIY